MEQEIVHLNLEANVCRLSEPGGAYGRSELVPRLDLETRIGNVAVPTLFPWGDQDPACGKHTAFATARYVSAPYRFELLSGHSHWLLEEAPDQIAEFVLGHIKGRPLTANPRS